MDALRQSLTGQQVTKDNLAHVATHLIVATQHVCQTVRFLTQLLCLLHHLQHLFTERGRVGGTFLLRVVDGLLHIADGLTERLGDARHRLRVLLLQFRGAGLQQLLGHILEPFLVPFQFFVHLLAHQFQFPRLTLGFCMQVLVLHLQMLHSAVGSIEQFRSHREFDILLAALDTERVHPAVHQQIEHHRSHRYTYYYI